MIVNGEGNVLENPQFSGALLNGVADGFQFQHGIWNLLWWKNTFNAFILADTQGKSNASIAGFPRAVAGENWLGRWLRCSCRSATGGHIAVPFRINYEKGGTHYGTEFTYTGGI